MKLKKRKNVQMKKIGNIILFSMYMFGLYFFSPVISIYIVVLGFLLVLEQFMQDFPSPSVLDIQAEFIIPIYIIYLILSLEKKSMRLG
tara:strand:+ start:845 stop:1108 length:264 start_codon:yes stop_codon:yes gene_type:complete